jgi:hypothetical protein
MFTVLINYLMEMVHLMVEMKRKQLIYKAKLERTSAGGGKTANTSREPRDLKKKK